ncbi:MutS-related protein [Saccharicrinis aurantiacus]|uniref:MutS-related protein n=1 Tax=Saccharicrinis aurantiacus TaxID=1849719 RepID=UPI00094F4ACF|nr:hypothetical protein [Saccharicrinis aurantiacus]
MESTRRVESRFDELIVLYKSKAQEYTNKLSKIKTSLGQIAWLRLLTFILLIAAPILLFPISAWAGGLSIVICISLFVLLIKKFNALKTRKSECEAIKELNENEIKAQQYNWDCFNDGKQFLDPEHNYSYDIDLFGKGSFFQYINRTITIGGEEYLAKHISTEELDASEISQNQNNFSELAKKFDFRQAFYGKGKIVDEKVKDASVIKDLKAYKNLFLDKSSLFKSLIYVLPALLFASIIASFYEAKFVSLISILLLVNLSIVGFYFKKVNYLHNKFSVLCVQLNKYGILAQLIQSEKFETESLLNIQNQLFKDGKNAAEVIQIFTKDLSQFDQRSGMIGGFILNGLLLWDLKYVLKIEKWIQQYHLSLDEWLDVIYKIDAYNSMAGFVYNHPGFIFPEMSSSKVFEVEELGHPLIDRKERVDNNYAFNNSIFALITGANMSGKSTFLRTVALNRVIAQSGMTVCAKKMVFKPMLLITNMRTSDNLMKHESYFFAELKRLKFIIDALYAGNEIFVILDEILKGTNSKDKTYGSMELIRHLLKLNVHGMIATHDLELGILEEESKGKVNNICFEVENTNNELKFDYKLYKGVTQNHNATFLMKQMKIIVND